MSRGQFVILILAAVGAGAALGGLTAPDASQEPTRDTASRELIVFETADCMYCRLFRRDVLPDLQTSRRADHVPIRFVDINDATPLEPALQSPLTIVPTTVLLVNGREAGRITGYTGRPLLNQMVSHMLAAY